MKRLRFPSALLILAAFVFVSHASAIALNQVDDFENGLLAGWSNGVPGALTNIATGGPAGLNDHYMRLVSDGVGQGGRLTTFNLQQWLGNYVGAGVNRIEIDLINQGATSVSMRLAFKSLNQPNVPGFLSPAMILAPGSGWQHFSIALTAGNLIAVGSPGAFNTFFTNGPADFRIIQEVGQSDLNGDFIVGQVGIDNIRAVPEPATVALLMVGGAALVIQRARNRSGLGRI